MPKPKAIRCAIYTRKSTEEGLEQEFNSLDAQREASAAYIGSQRHEGWTLVPDLYVDGGFSGGNMERPGLKQLLADVALGKIDVIVVYKVDRLTRSLADFSKIVDVLEKADASFVSVTQAFNTTTSMGRLMLNVLLSFAQFEREVTGERIRDKVAASKRKGMWMGGSVPLGYDVRERKLVVNEQEAATIRLIYERYLSLGSVIELSAELRQRGIVSKRQSMTRGGVPLRVGPLYHMLKNPIYAGQIRHKDELFAGEHTAIVDRDLFDRVQLQLADHRNNHGARWTKDHASPLVGRLVDHEGRIMVPSHSTKGRHRRYRYYVSRNSLDRSTPTDGWRVPAIELETAVRLLLSDWLTSQGPTNVFGDDPARFSQIITACREMSDQIANGPVGLFRRLVDQVEARVRLSPSKLAMELDASALGRVLGTAPIDAATSISLEAPIDLRRRGCELRLIVKSDQRDTLSRQDPALIQLIGRAERAHRQLLAEVPTCRIKRAEVVRLARLRTLAPDIVTAILDGTQPASLTARHLLRVPSLPMAWDEQRRLLGFSDSQL